MGLVYSCVKGQENAAPEREEPLGTRSPRGQRVAERALSVDKSPLSSPGPLDLIALLQQGSSETTHGQPLDLADLEVQLAHNAHAILVVHPTKVAAVVGHPPLGDGLLEHKAASKGAMHLADADVDSYVSVVRRLQQVAAPARGNKVSTDSIAQLEALKKKQASGHSAPHEHQTRLALLHANKVAHTVLGGAEGISSWVDVHISRNPMLLSQLKGNQHEVYNHYIPAQHLKGELLQLDVVLCPVCKGGDVGPALVIGMHLRGQDIQPHEVSVRTSLHLSRQQRQQQQQQLPQKAPPSNSWLSRARSGRSRGSKSLDLSYAGQHSQTGRSSKDALMRSSISTQQQQQQQQQQQHLYLALSHLPVAVTLISSSGHITWQNGRSAELLGLLSSKSGARRGAGQSLQQMFMLDPEALESLLLALKEGEAWNGLVQVPGREDMEHWTTESAIKVDTVDGSAGGEETQAGGASPTREALAHEACRDESFSCEKACPGASLPNHFGSWTQKYGPDLAPQDSGPGIGSSGPPGGHAVDSGSERPSLAAFSFPDSFPGHSSGAPSAGLPSTILPIFGVSIENAREGSERSPSLENVERSAGSGKCKSKKQATSAEADERLSLPMPPGPSSLRVRSCIWPHQPERAQNEEPATSPCGMRTSSCVFPAQMHLGRQSSSGLAVTSPRGLGVGGLSTSQIPHIVFKDGFDEAPLPHSRAKAHGRVGAAFRRSDKPALPIGSRQGWRRSVHTSGALIVQDQAFSGASRALQMSSSNVQLPAPISPRLDRSSVGVETCSLNWLAQGNVGNDAFTTSGVQAQPSHYFESIPEGRRPKISNLPGELSSGQQLLDTIINSKALDRFSLGMGAALQPLPLPNKIQAGTLPPLQLTSRRDHAQSASATLPHVPLRTYARDTKTTCSGSGPSVGFVDDATSKKATGTSERPTWSSCQVDEIPLDVAPVPPSKSTCQPKGQAGALTDAPSCSRTSVHSAAEESVMAPEHSWHYIDAFNIKGPAGEKLTVLTNQDVTYLVETQISLKQILDVEHKILEDIFPKHVLETQVATGAGLGRGLNDSLGVPLACSSRRQSSGSHLSSTTVGRVPSFCNLRDERGPGDVSPIRIESCIDMRSTDHKGGKHLENGTTSPLPKTTSAEFYRKSIRHDVLPVQESSQLHRRCIDSGSHDTIGDGRGHSLTGAPFLPASQGHNSGEHEGAFSFENAGLLRTRNSEGLPSTQGHMSNASSVLGDRAYGGNNRRDVVKGRLGRLRAPPKRNHSCSTVFQSSTAYSPRSTGLHLPIDYGSGPNSSARSFAPKPTLSGMGRHHENVTVMFADIKEFTSMSRAISSAEVMHFLHTLFSRFDALVDAMEELGLYKIETIGDCYMCAAGLLTRGEDGAMVLWEGDASPVHHLFTLARKMLEVASGMEMPASGGQPVVLRIGMHTGPVTSGIAGRKCPRFCLFGDTVNFAARMESTCLPGMIHMSQATWEALGSPDQAADPRWSRSPGVEAKGIGFVQTYLWNPKIDRGNGMRIASVERA